MNKNRLVLASFALVLLAGCHGTGEPPADAAPAKSGKVYPLRGKVVAVDPAQKQLSVASAAIPGYMAAMTMPYGVADPAVLTEVHAGDMIAAQIRVQNEMAPVLEHVVVVAQARPDAVPAVQYHVPQVGEVVPDFALLNQSGKTLHLHQFRGKVVLMTWIYTRCPVADFCPRMSESFAAIDKQLAANQQVYDSTQLLSVSFDPRYDTPAVLRSYGGAHTGRFTEEDFRHWQFAAPSVAELPAMEKWFDVGVTGSDPQSLQHTLSTLVIGKDGRVLAWYPTNAWKPAELAQQAAGAAMKQ